MISDDGGRFSKQRAAIDAAEIALASYQDEDGIYQIVVVKGRRLIETVLRNGEGVGVKQCFVTCRSRREATHLLSVFKDW